MKNDKLYSNSELISNFRNRSYLNQDKLQLFIFKSQNYDLLYNYISLINNLIAVSFFLLYLLE